MAGDATARETVTAAMWRWLALQRRERPLQRRCGDGWRCNGARDRYSGDVATNKNRLPRKDGCVRLQVREYQVGQCLRAFATLRPSARRSQASNGLPLRSRMTLAPRG